MRLIIGDLQGDEAYDFLLAAASGLDGALACVHAASPRDAFSRVELLAQLGAPELPLRVLRELAASAVQVVVQMARFAGGDVRVAHVAEVVGVEGDAPAIRDIFVFRSDGRDANGHVQGRFAPTGVVPRFCEEMQKRGARVEMALFRA